MERGVIAAVVVIVVRSVKLNWKSLDETFSGLDDVGSRLPSPVCL